MHRSFSICRLVPLSVIAFDNHSDRPGGIRFVIRIRRRRILRRPVLPSPVPTATAQHRPRKAEIRG